MSDWPPTSGRLDTSDLRVGRAGPEHRAAISRLIGSLELAYPSMDLDRFWFAESGGELVGAAELKEFGSCALLSCVGVRESLQGRGIGRILVERVVAGTSLPVYLYTLVPGFFAKCGFSEATTTPADLPPRSTYGCAGCDPVFCRCLVRLRP
jgi:N-acetylglutamate synthase-like GNAT family acetyltransferase